MTCSTAAWAQRIGQDPDQVVSVTTHYSNRSKVKKDKSRIQMRLKGDSAEIWGFYFGSLPRKIRSIKSRPSNVRFGRSQLQRNIIRSLDSTYSLVCDTSYGFRTKIPSKQEYIRLKTRYVGGNNSSGYFSNQWVRLAVASGTKLNKSFSTKGWIFRHGSYQVEKLPGAMAWELPAVDPWQCVPAEELFFHFIRMQGYGLDKIRYQPYEERQREIVRASFEIYFERNESRPDQVGLQSAIDYLEQNQYVILNATLEGAASVEGSQERNQALQAERASVLSAVLKKYNDNEVKKDTVILSDAWQPFREQIKQTSFAWLDTLSDEGIRQQLNQNDSIRTALEPILKTQRKASLKLVMTKKLSDSEKLAQVQKTLSLWCSQLRKKGATQAEAERRLMGIVEYLFKKYQHGNIDQETLGRIFTETENGDYLQVLLGYHIMKQFQENTYRKVDAIPWTEYWTRYKLDFWFLQAKNSLIALLSAAYGQDDKAKYLKMYADLQAYTYRFIYMGLIDINSLCTMSFPERKEFMGLILNQYAFLYEMAREKGVELNCITARTKSVENVKKDSVQNIDTFLEDLDKKMGIRTITRIGSQQYLKPSFDTQPKGPYYFLLKQSYLKGNNELLKWTETSAGGQLQLNVFNLFHLVSMNVDNFNPFENHFYDKEVQLEEMDRLVSQLKRIDATVCRPQINELYLNYHLKALYYLERYFSPGSEKQSKIADVSLAFISEYYKKRSRVVSPRLSLHIVKQMNLFNWLPSSRPGAWYGYDLLNTVARQRILNDEEIMLYSHYKKMYDPLLKDHIPPELSKSQIMELWDRELWDREILKPKEFISN